jgi:hypothetical protein
MVGYLPSMCKGLGSVLSTAKTHKKKKKKEEEDNENC